MPVSDNDAGSRGIGTSGKAGFNGSDWRSGTANGVHWYLCQLKSGWHKWKWGFAIGSYVVLGFFFLSLLHRNSRRIRHRVCLPFLGGIAPMNLSITISKEASDVPLNPRP